MKICSSIFSSFRTFFEYFHSLLHGLDPIFDHTDLLKNSLNKSSFNLKYFVPLVLTTGIILDFIILIIKNDFRLHPIPEIFHRIFFLYLEKYWDQLDVIFTGAYIFVWGTYFNLTMNGFVHRTNFLYRKNPQKTILYKLDGSSEFCF